jgi:hypothetical protein
MLRIDPEHPEHRGALRDALVRGVELFDLGDFTAPAFSAKARLLQTLVEECGTGRIRAMVRGNLGVADQLIPALDAIGEEFPKIEWIYLVADPEFALARLDWDHARLYSLLAQDLDTLEEICADGRLGAYGIGSAGLTYAKESADALALAPLLFGENFEWDAPTPAHRPRNRAHFGWIEFPLNLYESGAAFVENQSLGAETLTLLEVALRWDLVAVARRPLDAITEVGLRRLIAYPDHHRLDLDEAVKRTLEVALESERAPGLEPASPRWAHRLHGQLRHVVDPEQWKEILRRRIEPDLAGLAGPYRDAMNALVLAVKLWLEKSAAERNERLRCRIVEALPTLARTRLPSDRDLALLALRIYRSIPGLRYVLIGMRSPRYVHAFTDAERGFPRGETFPREEIEAALVAVHAALDVSDDATVPKGSA